MQKKVIALAVAGLISGGAFAQSNVTIYGVMDAYAGVAKADNVTGNQSQTFVNSGGLSGSRLGFLGEEALGNGLKGIFKLELGSLDITTATNSIGSTRESYVGLKSDTLGQVHMGRVQTVGYYWAQKYDPMVISPAFSLSSTAGRATGQIFLNNGANGRIRQDNAVAYISPSFGGVVISANYAVGEQVTGTTGTAGFAAAQKFSSLGAEYDQGQLSVGLVYSQLNDNSGTTNGKNGAGTKDWGIAAKYDFGVVKPMVQYQEAKNTQAVGADYTNKMWNVGVHIPVFGGDNLKLAYMDLKNDQANAVKANGYAAIYQHEFSKRTTAYAGYEFIHNGTFSSMQPGASDVRTSAGKNASTWGVGLRHTF